MNIQKYYNVRIFVYIPNFTIAAYKQSSETLTSTEQNVTATAIEKDAYQIVQEKCAEYNNGIFCIITRKKSSPRSKLYFDRLTGPMPYPHMALIGYNEKLEDIYWNCGGSLISERYVLTAAQCVSLEKFGDAQWVRLGVLKINHKKHDDEPKDLRIIERIVHPEYKPSKYNNDIAILKLESDVKFSPYIKPICLHPTTEIPASVMNYGAITGWGDDGPGNRKIALLEAFISFLDDKECKDYYANDSLIENGYDAQTMVCAANKKTPTGPCDGDGGGPLQIPNPNNGCTWAEIGIMSDLRCGKTNPTLYTRIFPFIPWIQKIVWP